LSALWFGDHFRQQMSWHVNMILCSDNTLYTGISKDVERRVLQHARQRGAKYFRARRPKRLVYLESGHSHSTASRREAAIKKMQRSDKVRLIDSECNEMILSHD
jgi:putative endonuclease